MIIASGIPHEQHLGAEPTPCPTCRRGPRERQRRYTTISLMLIPLFSMQSRQVNVCRSCGAQELTNAPEPAGAPPIPVHRRLTGAVLAAALCVGFVGLSVPMALNKRARDAASAELLGTPEGAFVKELVRGEGCGRYEAPKEERELSCSLGQLARDVDGGKSKYAYQTAVEILKGSPGGVLVGVSALKDSDAEAIAKAVELELVKAFPKGTRVAIAVGWGSAPSAIAEGKLGEPLQYHVGSALSPAPLIKLVSETGGAQAWQTN